MSARATTTRRAKRPATFAATSAGLATVALAAGMQAQTFSAAPVVFSPTGSNSGLAQQVNITLTAASTIRSIAIPLSLAARPEFFLVDNGGCVEDGTTVNAAGTVCSLVVRFHPAIAGVRTASLVVTDGAGNATAVPISGVGYYPQIAIIPAAMKIVAGQGPSQSGLHGDGDAAILATLTAPTGVAADSFGNVYLADTGNNVVRMLDAFGNITTVAGGGTLAGSAADGGAATAAQLSSPTWIAVDAAGNLYVSESGSHVVRRVAAGPSGKISTIAGSYARGFGGDGGTATAAKLDTPTGLAVDAAGNLYIADSGNFRVRRVDVAGNIDTFAGTGTSGFNPTSTPAASAQFAALSALALDASGNLFAADTGNHAVREVKGGNVTVVAGTGGSGLSGDGGAATAAKLNSPAGVAVSPAGDIYVSDAVSGTVRKVQASDGTIETVAGNAANVSAFTGGVRPSTLVQMNKPLAVAFDTAASLLVADSGNNVVRAMAPSPAELTFAAQAAGTASAPQTFRIENIGNAPLTLAGAAVADSTTSSNFTLASGASDACGTTLASGAHCSYSVAYAPAQNGAVGGEVDVTYQTNNPNFNSIAPVYLKGGATGTFAITPATLPSLLVNTAASVAITTTGSTGAVSLDLEGTLPPGMTLSASSGTLTLSGTPTKAGSYSFTVFAADALGATATQAYTLQVSPVTIPLNVVESIQVTDSPQTQLSVQLTITESVHVTDAPTEQPSLLLAVSEAIHVSDTARETPSLLLAITETVHVADALVEQPSVVLAVSETIHVSDAPTEQRSLTLAVSEAIHVNDVPTGLPSLLLAVTEAIHVNDAPASLPTLTLAVTETISIADASSNVRSISTAAGEAITVTDLITLTLDKAAQTITPPTISTHRYGDAAFAVTATASSGLPVTIAVASGPASFSNGSLDITGAGSITLALTQPGDATYSPAAPATVSFSPAPALLTVTANDATRAFETPNPAFQFSLSGLVHGDTAPSVSGTPALITSAVANSPAGVYPIRIAAGTLQAANYTFNLVPGTLTVTGNTAQTITFGKLPNVPLGIGPLTLTAHSTSGLACTYTVTGPVTVQGSRLLLTGAGTVTVTAAQSGNATFNAASPVSRTFTVAP